MAPHFGLFKKELKLWETKLQAKEGHMLEGERDVNERLEKELAEKVTELRKKERSLDICESLEREQQLLL